MNINPTPDELIHNLIIGLETSTTMSLRLIHMEPKLNENFGFKSWEYRFKVDESPVFLEVVYSVINSDKVFCQCIISKNEKTYFSFSDYMTFIKDSELSKLETDNQVSFEPANYVRGFLNLLKKQLVTGLNKVVTGEVWIDVPFDWKKAGR